MKSTDRYDFANELELLIYYPLVLMLFDCFEPSRAALIIEVAGEYDEQVCGLVWRFAAETARERLSMN